MARSTVFSDAVVLRSVEYDEADRIVTLLTRTHGKIALIARGARRSRKRFGGVFEPFQVIVAEYAFGRGEVGTCASGSIKQAYPAILRDLEKMTLAGRALEWVRIGTPTHLPEPELFTTVVEFFEELDEVSAELGPQTLLAFLVRLADHLGFAPRFHVCGLCEKPAPPAKPGTFDARLGALVCRSCGGASIRLSASLRAKLLAAQRGEPPKARNADDPAKGREEDEQAIALLDLVLREHVDGRR